MTHQYRFGDVLIDEQSFRLLKAGKPLAVEPKALNVLIFLVQHQGRLIERREILSAIWGDAYVTDHVLNRSIGQLHKLLSDDAKEPRYIETVPTLGYRFIAQVETETLELALFSPARGRNGEQALPSGAPVEVALTSNSEAASSPRPVRTAGISKVRMPILVCLGLVGIGSIWVRYRPLRAMSPVRSLAVLPLEDLSAGMKEGYFADGMTDELITELAHIPGLRIVSRTSVMQEKGTHKSLGQLARELDVDAIVEGSVVRSGDRIRVTAQLIDTRSDKHLWAQSFEGAIGDILSLQDSVARQISLQTSAVLTPSVRSELATARRVEPAAYDAYLRGLYFIQRRDGDLAVSYFRKAIALQPDYGAANAGLAQALVMQTLADAGQSDAIMPSAIAAVERAIELDPTSGEAYTSMGAIDTTYLWDWNSAEQNLRKGIELSPSSSNAETWYAVFLISVGRPAEAVTAMQRAVTLDPLSFWANRLLGSTLYYARRYDESLFALKRALEIAPDKYELVEGWNSGNFEVQGRYNDAFEADLKDLASEISPRELASFHLAFSSGGWKAYQKARVKFLLSRSKNVCQMNPIAMSYVRLGNFNEAIRWFNRDEDKRCGRTVFDLSSDPRLDEIRGDERFRALLRRVNLPH